MVFNVDSHVEVDVVDDAVVAEGVLILKELIMLGDYMSGDRVHAQAEISAHKKEAHGFPHKEFGDDHGVGHTGNDVNHFHEGNLLRRLEVGSKSVEERHEQNVEQSRHPGSHHSHLKQCGNIRVFNGISQVSVMIPVVPPETDGGRKDLW